MTIRDYLPHTSTRLAMVYLDDRRPFRAYWPIRNTQLIGGKTWALSFIKYSTQKPVEIKGDQA
ncbi:hypothetical protein [Prescottella agglutinans]|jgi:hypothetical protein|uniref:Uncharacterized protein n=1 Tax=Prescottella agglutinans TaxID=1644129 RepID=A0ABT6MI75_9NOCA|nr:hypothetical protein [Prescottella agglutinans]MDH6284023.1 hypothetical protein [Prescottella agglutinans]